MRSSAIDNTIIDAIKQKTAVIFFLNNILNEKAERSYVYFAVKLKNVAAFVAASRSHGDVYDLESFGKVILYGTGSEPTPEHQMQMKEEFGFRPEEAVVLH